MTILPWPPRARDTDYTVYAFLIYWVSTEIKKEGWCQSRLWGPKNHVAGISDQKNHMIQLSRRAMQPQRFIEFCLCSRRRIPPSTPPLAYRSFHHSSSQLSPHSLAPASRVPRPPNLKILRAGYIYYLKASRTGLLEPYVIWPSRISTSSILPSIHREYTILT